MRYLIDAARLVGEVLWYGVATRRLFLPLLVITCIVIVVVVIVVKALAPVVIYPLA